MLSLLTSVTTKMAPSATSPHSSSPADSWLLRRRASAQLTVPMFVLTGTIGWGLASVGNDCILSTQSTPSQAVGLLASSSAPPLVRTELSLRFDVSVLGLCRVLFLS